jgi:DNA polymerase delta subunit 1
MQVQAVAWEGEDADDQFVIRVYGRSQEHYVCVTVPFDPYFFIKLKPQHDLATMAFALSQTIKYKNMEEVRAKDLWGFRNEIKERFVKVSFFTLKNMKICAHILQQGPFKGFGQLKVYEANVDPVLRFMHVSGIRSTGWFEVSGGEHNNLTTCHVDLYNSTLTPVERDDIAPLVIMSFDIECYSSTGEFPNPSKRDDVVFQIGMTTKRFGSPEIVRKCLCLKQTQAPDCESFQTEKQLLIRFEEYMTETDPDIITGWNIFGFDLEYLQVRSVLNGLAPTWGRFKDSPIELVSKNLSSSALGNNMLKMVPMRGRYVFDFFQDVKRDHKLESYSLNNVSKHFLKDQKNDMPVKEIFGRYLEGDPVRLGEVAEYCLQDTVLPHKLLDKLFQIQNQIEMAKACWVPLSFLSERGQQIKVFSQMAYKARQLGFLIPTFKKTGPSLPTEKYQGATVLEAQTGAYYGPITALDFASLYPSIMCAHNLCYSTMVMDPQFDNLPGVEYETFGPHKFAQNVPSLLPVILSDLKAYRKKAKKLMAQAEGTPMEAVYNGQQLAYKISMNSIYGFCGASKGLLPLVAIASTVTMRGRQMIEETKNYVEANFPGANVRYGDTGMFTSFYIF